MKTKVLFALLILFVVSFSLYANDRTDNIDVFILLDKSLSMQEDNKIHYVREYVNNFILDRIIIPGDRLYIINFFGQTEVFVNTIIRDENHIEEIKQDVLRIRADGRFTDIGNALNTLVAISARYEGNNRLKYMLLMTDGRQEAPPGSPYQWELGRPFNHRFLENTRVIEKKGWKIFVLGLGRDTDARLLAEELSARYAEIDTGPVSQALSEDDSPSLLERLIEETSDFLSVVRVVSGPSISYRGFFQRPYIEFTTEASFLSAVKDVSLASIIITDNQSRESGNIIESAARISFTEDGTKNIRIPVTIPDNLPDGTITGELRFVYGTQNLLTPSLFNISFTNKSIIERFLVHLIILGIILLALLLLAAKSLSSGSGSRAAAVKQPIAAKSFTPVAAAAGSGLAFFFYLNGKKLQELPFVLNNKENIFLNLSPTGAVDLSKTKNEFTKAMLTAKGKVLSMEVFDKSILNNKKQKLDNILEMSINFLKKGGKDLILSFKRK
ncbi:MAG: VWA domain-containing protein [Spirochaetes bacterium]|nr:VWA domain-containing protein [Spirochaetota bacterium]